MMISGQTTRGGDWTSHLGRWLVDNMPRGLELQVPERRDRGREMPFVEEDADATASMPERLTSELARPAI